MLNEGVSISNTATAMRTEMMRQLDRLDEATAEEWERRVFLSLTGRSRGDVDWTVEDNHAGLFTWVKAFNDYIKELVDDGFVRSFECDGRRLFALTDGDPAIGWSQVVDPTR